MPSIDVVIPHVDGRAPGYEALCRAHTGHFVPCQVRDLGELRYVLRSLDRFAPWVSRVLLVVQDEGHLPPWLARERVVVVTHDAFVPAEHRPTFHWATIAAYLHRIPGLADRFVIWEDDVLLARPASAADLFAEDGLPRADPYLAPIVPGLERLLQGYQHNLEATRALLARRGAGWACFVYPHIPVPVERRSWAAMMDSLADDPVFRDTVTRRARTDEATRPTVDPLVLYANWVDLVVRRRSAARRFSGCARYLATAAVTACAPLAWRRGVPLRFGGYALVNDPARARRRMRRLLAERPLFVNVNDDAYDSWRDADGVDWSTRDMPSPGAMAELTAAFEALYPSPSRFERAA